MLSAHCGFESQRRLLLADYNTAEDEQKQDRRDIGETASHTVASCQTLQSTHSSFNTVRSCPKPRWTWRDSKMRTRLNKTVTNWHRNHHRCRKWPSTSRRHHRRIRLTPSRHRHPLISPPFPPLKLTDLPALSSRPIFAALAIGTFIPAMTLRSRFVPLEGSACSVCLTVRKDHRRSKD